MIDAIFHILKKILFLSSAHKLMDRCVRNAKDQDPKNRSVRLFVVVRKAAFEGLFASCFTEVGWMVFSASFGLCCFSLKRWPILSRMGDQRRLPHCDPMKLASYKPRKSDLIAQLPHCTAKCGHEAKQWKNSFFVAAQPTGFMILQFRRNRAFDAEDCNYCLFLG